jgi:excisionase family DNA binding protein
MHAQRDAEGDRLLDIDELATYIGVPRQTIYRWRMEAKGPRASKLGRHLRYRRQEIDDWILEQLDDR